MSKKEEWAWDPKTQNHVCAGAETVVRGNDTFKFHREKITAPVESHLKHTVGEERIFVAIFCDVCGKKIEKAKDGLVLYRRDGSVCVCHEATCAKGIKKWGTAPLASFLIRALMGLGANPIDEYIDAMEDNGELVEVGCQILEWCKKFPPDLKSPRPARGKAKGG